MKKHTKFVAYALAGFIAVSTINVPSVYAEEIPTETVVDTTNNSATDTTTETPTDSTADSSTETPADSTADSSSTSTNKTTVKKATATKKQTVKIKKYKKSKKLYVKKATKAYKVTSTGKLKVAKSLKKSAKVTVVGTAKVKKVKYYAIKSGKSTLLVKQSLLSKTKPKAAKPSSKPSTNNSNSSNSSTSKHPIPQNNTPSGYKGPTNWYGKVDKYGNSPARDLKTVKVVDGKVEYRDIDGKIKYGKCKYWDDGYYYWYTMKDGRGFWMPIENTNLEYWDESDINGMWNEQNMDIKG